MITAAELAVIPLFAVLDESARQRLAQKAADVRVEGGDWVIREGEDPRFFAILEGLLQVVKDIVGQRRELEQLSVGGFFGEIPILLGTANLVSVQAVSRCRLARFDRQQLQELISRFLLLRHHHFSDDDGSALNGAAVCKGHSLLTRGSGGVAL